MAHSNDFASNSIEIWFNGRKIDSFDLFEWISSVLICMSMKCLPCLVQFLVHFSSTLANEAKERNVSRAEAAAECHPASVLSQTHRPFSVIYRNRMHPTGGCRCATTQKKKQQANRNSKPNCCGVGRNLNQFRFLLSVKCISCSLVSKFCSSWPEVHPLFNSQIYLHFFKKEKHTPPPPHYAAHPPSRNEFEWMK